MGLFVVTVQDTVIQVREYVTRAISKNEAEMNVEHGHFMYESVPTTVDTLESEIKTIEEIK